jgi:hypothetical protein
VQNLEAAPVATSLGLANRARGRIPNYRHFLAQSGNKTYNRRDDKHDRRKFRERPKRRRHSVAASPVYNQNGRPKIGKKIFIPNGRNPLKSLVSKK